MKDGAERLPHRNVWYAAYGSNLSRARFDCYLRGGCPQGAAHTFPGCRDTSPPTDDTAGEIDAELAFGGASVTWGGGVAFVKDGSTRAKARFYLLTLEQFSDVVAQENWLDPGSVLIEPGVAMPITLEGEHMYRLVVPLGDRSRGPVLTVSQPPDTRPSPPSTTYLRHIADGLREAHAMTSQQIVDYLMTSSGVRGALDAADLAAAVS